MAFGFLVWAILSVCVGCAADKRGRSFGGWLVFSLLLSPLIGAIAVLLLGEKRI